MNIRKAKQLHKNSIKSVYLKALIQTIKAANSSKYRCIPQKRNVPNLLKSTAKVLKQQNIKLFRKLLKK